MTLRDSHRLCKYLAAALVFFLVSCGVPHNMVVPTALNVPEFTQKGESSVNTAISHRGFDLQGGYALSHHFAITGSWYRRWETHNETAYHKLGWGPWTELDSIRYTRNLFSIGPAYFTPVNKRKTRFFMISAGYGLGSFRFLSHSYPSPNFDTARDYHSFYYHAAMSRVFLQPAIFDHQGGWTTIFSVRWAGTFYYRVQSSPDPDLYGRISNRMLSFIEPALTLRSAPVIEGLRVNMQIGASLNTSEIDYEYSPVIGNIGLDIDPVKLFRKKKDKAAS